MLLELDSPIIFLSYGSINSASDFPPQGPFGQVPPIHRYYSDAPTSCQVPDRFVASPSLYRSVRASLAGPLRFLGNPFACMPYSTTPTDFRARPLQLLHVAFRWIENVGFRDNFYFVAQSHGLQARCLRFAAWVTPGLAQDSLPGGSHPYLDGTCTRWVSYKGFSYIASSIARLS